MKTQFIFSRLGMRTTVHRGSDIHMKRQAGFTLIELAVVVFLIGLIASMGITALKSQLASASANTTKKKQDIIKDALVAYLAKNKRLPCPAVNSLGGIDAASGVRTTSSPPNCITNFGIVPYAELGLPKSAAIDGWDNFFTYAVSQAWTATLSSSITATTTTDATNAFNVGNAGTIKVNDRIPASQDPPTLITSGAVVVLISHGANGSGAYTTKGTQNVPPTGEDEISNSLPQATLPASVPFPAKGFFQREYTDKDAGHGTFDDVVTWLSPSDILTPLIKDGVLQSAFGQWANQVANIKEWVVGQILSSPSCTVPLATDLLGSAQNLATDPWGNTISSSSVAAFKYTRNITAITSAVPASTTIYTLNNTTANQTIQGPLVSWLQGTYQKCNN